MAVAVALSATTAQAAAPEMTPLPPRPVTRPVADCAALARQELRVPGGPAFKIASAAVEPAAGERAEFCLVKGYIAPQVQFELRLPTAAYTGRYLQSGCGAMCGVVGQSLGSRTNDRRLFSGAFAVAFDNAGHYSAGDATWAIGAPELRADFAYRSSHKTATVAKAVIAAYYGAPPQFSYFAGCSNGGRQGLNEVQKFPNDFNGVVVGSSISMPVVMNRYIWEAQAGLDAQGQPIITRDDARLLHGAVMARCDDADGVKDGQIDDPRACRFDPAEIGCKPGAAAGSCLTPAQVAVVRKLYQGPLDEKGRRQFPGGAPYGSELDWHSPGGFTGQVKGIATAFMTNLVFPGQLPESFGWRDWRFTSAQFDKMRKAAAAYEAGATDLSPFRKAGGKLLMWQGTADNTAGAYGMPEYLQAVGGRMGGPASIRDFTRLFMVPAVYHCAGGYLPYETDLLAGIVDWVELGRAPDALLATAPLPGGATRQRPVFAYPAKARYRGGDINAAASFTAETPAGPVNDAYPWVGSPLRAR
ncbi:MAG: tannase/feruloyl esterase family alpha/beta hydrolase [Caulobacteraceae bacterium]